MATRDRYWAWLGPTTEISAALASPAASPAAAKWQAALLGAIRHHGTAVDHVSYCPERLWPRGPLLAGFGQRHRGGCVPYINAAPFRAATRAGAFGVQLATLIARRQGRPEFVLTYNVDAASAVPAMILQAAGVPWIAVIADMPDDFLRRRSHDILNARPAGHVFLSWETYLEWPGEPKLHLDGGIDGVDHESGTAVVERAVLYSGVLGEYGGVDTLLDAFLRLSDSKAQLWVCGKGRNARLEAASRHDPRIKLWGAVDDSTLQSLSRRALAFVNPRPTSMPASRNNFPSKLLEYLRWGKPVISTWTEGLAPAYRDVLLVVDDNVEAFTRALQTVLQMPAALQDETAARIRTYAAEHSWDAQSVRLIKWLRECTWRI